MIIDTKEVSKIYKMGKIEVQALKGVSIQIEEGEYLTIMGPSGSGKSTLMHILGCLDTPTSGIYFLGGKRVDNLDDDTLAEIRNKEIGFVFQSFNLIPRVKAYENVELPLLYRGTPPKEAQKQAIEALNLVGLGDRINHKPNELSGGETQRVAIARAIITNPRVIFADEPTGNLDTKASGEIMGIFDKLNKQGKTVIIVTHDVEVSAHTKRIIKIRDGIVV
ncbi:MAG: ABC transporter ATP-binding protein [bacterium]|nr:ABC transporter ATP-binding protein [bacterium]